MPDRPSPPTVAMPRGLLIALCAVLAVALMAVAFLMGRTSARPVASAVPEAAAVAPPLSAATAPPPTLAAPAPGPVPGPAAVAFPGLAAAAPQPVLSPANPNERAAVVRYFAELERIDAANKNGGDLQQIANQLVQQAASGDSSGFDQLMASERRAREGLRAVDAPAACRAHHAEAVALMDAAIDLLGRLGQATTSGDASALEGFVGTARDLETRTKALEATGTALKRQYGIAVPAS